MHDHNESLQERAAQFLQLASSGSVDDAYARFVAPAGKHHSPHFATGFDALKTGMKENYRQFPNKQLTLKHALSEADLVAIHSHLVLEPGDLGVAVLHLFRFEDGKIVELWDFAQPVPAESPNADGLF
jgi:predicted SnoaL-like aldol condensation-catalyzing enzyme